MKRSQSISTLATFAVLLSGASAPSSEPARFEVASVKPHADRDVQRRDGDAAAGRLVASGALPEFSRPVHGRMEIRAATLANLIQRAYSLKTFEVTGPVWIATDRFDVLAKLPDGAAEEQVPEMLQSLLAERFELAAHRQARGIATYRLVAAKDGPRLKPSESDAHSVHVSMPPGIRRIKGDVSLRELIGFISKSTDRPVEDGTGLKGNYVVDLEWAADDAAGDVAAPALSTALRERLGLKLEPAKSTAEVMVVDRARRTPTGN